jgi:Fe2+ transport system protein FeoA
VSIALPTMIKTRPAKSSRICRLSDLQSGDTGRIVRVEMPDVGCRKRFAELGLAAGMAVTVTGGGDTMLLAIGGSRMGLGRHCAQQITVMKIDA